MLTEWNKLAQWFPSIILQLAIASLITCAFWYAFTRKQKYFAFDWLTPIGMALTFTALSTLNTMVKTYQEQKLASIQGSGQGAQREGASVDPQGQPELSPELKLRGQFISQIDYLINNPDQYSKTAKEDLFKTYSGLFAEEKDKQIYYDYISRVLECEKAYYQDALASQKAKKIVKSSTRAKCETYDGKLFNREKIVPANILQTHEQIIAIFAGQQPVPTDTPDFVNQAKKNIEKQLNKYQSRMTVLKQIFTK